MTRFRPALSCLIVLSLAPVTGVATRVYQSQAPDGSTLFSDQPGPQAREIDIDVPPPPAPPEPAPAAPAETTPADPGRVVYRSLKIVEPKHDALFWFAEGPVKVQTEIVPPLAKGHVLLPLLNGVPQGTGVEASGFSLTGLDPDTYELVVVIRDARGRELKRSAAVRFHFRRQSVNLPQRQPPPPPPPRRSN